MKEIFMFQDNDVDKMQCLAIELIGRHFNFKYLVVCIEEDEEMLLKDALFNFQIIVIEDDGQDYILSLKEIAEKFNVDCFNEIKS